MWEHRIARYSQTTLTAHKLHSIREKIDSLRRPLRPVTRVTRGSRWPGSIHHQPSLPWKMGDLQRIRPRRLAATLSDPAPHPHPGSQWTGCHGSSRMAPPNPIGGWGLLMEVLIVRLDKWSNLKKGINHLFMEKNMCNGKNCYPDRVLYVYVWYLSSGGFTCMSS